MTIRGEGAYSRVPLKKNLELQSPQIIKEILSQTLEFTSYKKGLKFDFLRCLESGFGVGPSPADVPPHNLVVLDQIAL